MCQIYITWYYCGLSLSGVCAGKQKSQLHFKSNGDLANPLLVDFVPGDTKEIFKGMLWNKFRQHAEFLKKKKRKK